MGKEWAAMKEQLRETLDKVSLIPMRECEQEAAAVLIGAVGLELYAAYSKLCCYPFVPTYNYSGCLSQN